MLTEPKLNRDIDTRDTLIFGEYKPDAYRGGIRHFEGLTVDTLKTLVSNTFISPAARQNDAPTAAQFLAFMERYPEYTAHGYAVSIERGDYGILLEGVSKNDGADSMDELADFVELFRDADAINTASMYCWFD